MLDHGEACPRDADVHMPGALDFKDRLGISTVFITHDLSAAYYLGGDIMVMQNGRVVETGSAVEVMNHPTEAYTKLLLESIPSPDPDERWIDRAVPVEELERAMAASGAEISQ